jgi:cell division protein FtsZ
MFVNPVKQKFMTQSIPAMPTQAAAPSAAPAVQKATPRPTSFNVFDFDKIKDDSEVELFTRPVAKPAAQPKPVAETAPIPSLTETQVVRNINAAMFNSPEFNAAAPAEEETVAQGSETSEFSAVAEEDRMNGGRGGVEKTMAFAGMDAPAYTRQTMAAEATSRATVASRSDFADSQDFVDLSVPAYLRNRENNMNNF